MLDIFCEVTFKKQPDKTSILTVKLDELSFKSPNSASYITEHKSVSYHSSGSNVYSSSGGTRLIAGYYWPFMA